MSCGTPSTAVRLNGHVYLILHYTRVAYIPQLFLQGVPYKLYSMECGRSQNCQPPPIYIFQKRNILLGPSCPCPSTPHHAHPAHVNVTMYLGNRPTNRSISQSSWTLPALLLDGHRRPQPIDSSTNQAGRRLRCFLTGRGIPNSADHIT